MRLRFDEARNVLKLTCPPRTSARAALRWAAEQREWIDRQIATRAPAEPFEPDTVIPIAGEQVRLIWSPDSPRVGRLEGAELRVGGSRSGFERRVEAFLRRHALHLMSQETAELAAGAGLRAATVSVGDASTRWGSCSQSGRIRLSWRLILASPEVRRFVVAHEVAHLKHLDHGPAFRALERELVGPGLAEARDKLKLEGARLRRLGRRD